MSTDRRRTDRRRADRLSVPQLNPAVQAGLKPYQQGELDGFCGLYAIINAMRIVCWPHQAPRSLWQELFSRLMHRVEQTVGAGEAAVHGLDSQPFWKIAKLAADIASSELGLDLSVGRPFKRDRHVSWDAVLAWMRDTARLPHHAIAFGLTGGLDHWTVLRSVSSASLMLFDSSAHSRVGLDRCGLIVERHGAPRPLHGIQRQDILLFRRLVGVVPTDADQVRTEGSDEAEAEAYRRFLPDTNSVASTSSAAASLPSMVTDAA